MKKNKTNTAKKIVKKPIQVASTTPTEILARYRQLKELKAKILDNMCDGMHIKADFEDDIVLSKLLFKDETDDMLELERYEAEMQKNYELIRNVEMRMVHQQATLEVINLELFNL